MVVKRLTKRGVLGIRSLKVLTLLCHQGVPKGVRPPQRLWEILVSQSVPALVNIPSGPAAPHGEGVGGHQLGRGCHVTRPGQYLSVFIPFWNSCQ